jgi:hypothetical protein
MVLPELDFVSVNFSQDEFLVAMNDFLIPVYLSAMYAKPVKS